MLTTLISICALAAPTVSLQQGGFGGGGFGGGGFGGGFGGGRQGGNQQQYDGTVAQLESAIDRYLNGDETKNILTPGEYSEWPLTLKAGEVVIAEARSDAFDPALEVVDGQGEGDHKVLASNDDRYPGDQRPLLLWRCEKDGAYALRVRCFHDRSGGQLFLRMRIYDSMDLSKDGDRSKQVEAGEFYLIRLPLRAGQVKQVLIEQITEDRPISAELIQAISPTGLPDIGLIGNLDKAIFNSILAPVDGDYYFLAYASHGPFANKGKLALGVRELAVESLNRQGEAINFRARSGKPSIWSLSIKAGELLEISTPDLSGISQLAVAEEPSYAKWDIKKSDSNPFYPKAPSKEPNVRQAFVALPARSRDPRYAAVVANRDVRVLIASQAIGPKGEFTLSVKPAASSFEVGKESISELGVGSTEYWAFHANVGDVMTFQTRASGFAERVVLRGPELESIWNGEVGPEGDALRWNLVAKKAGRYLVAISSVGDGGGGSYSLSRQVFRAKEFSKEMPAQGRVEEGKTEVWKFEAKPAQPLLVHWFFSRKSANVSVFDEKGEPVYLPSTEIDAQNSYGILKVSAPTTYLVIISPIGEQGDFRIELRDLPGYFKAGAKASSAKESCAPYAQAVTPGKRIAS